MLNNLFKKIRYLLKYSPQLLMEVANWYELPLLILGNKSLVLKLRNGAKFRVSHYLDVLTVKEIFIDRDYEINMPPPTYIIDIGANIGTYSIFAALIYPNCHIFSYEPARKTFSFLRQNLKLNRINNVETHRVGVGGKAGRRNFYTHPAGGLSSLTRRREGVKKEIVYLTTLKKIFDKESLKFCDLVKMDCEGAEYEILLNTPPSIFAKISRFVIEYHEGFSELDYRDIIRKLKSNGYKTKRKKHRLERDIGIIYAQK